MRRRTTAKLALILGVLVSSFAFAVSAARAACEEGPVALQVLGSGGPFGHGRASAGYLVWIDGVARVMVDAGGGTFLRFHEAGAEVGELELLALSHFHPDHSAAVPALLWIKPTGMPVAGPTGSNAYPSLEQYVDGLFGPAGVFRAVTGGKGLDTVTIDASRGTATTVLENETLRVLGLGVPHGIVPAIAYRVDVGDAGIVFASDQNGSDPAFVEFAAGADVMVAHVAVPETVTGSGADLHAKPSAWGRMAADAGVGTLVLSHLSGIAPRSPDGSLQGFDEKLDRVREHYKGSIVVAEDLLCIPAGTPR